MSIPGVTGIQFEFSSTWLDPKSVVYGRISCRTVLLSMYTSGRVVIVCECFVGLVTFVSTTGATGTQFGICVAWLDPKSAIYGRSSCWMTLFACACAGPGGSRLWVFRGLGDICEHRGRHRNPIWLVETVIVTGK